MNFCCRGGVALLLLLLFLVIRFECVVQIVVRLFNWLHSAHSVNYIEYVSILLIFMSECVCVCVWMLSLYRVWHPSPSSFKFDLISTCMWFDSVNFLVYASHVHMPSTYIIHMFDAFVYPNYTHHHDRWGRRLQQRRYTRNWNCEFRYFATLTISIFIFQSITQPEHTEPKTRDTPIHLLTCTYHRSRRFNKNN